MIQEESPCKNQEERAETSVGEEGLSIEVGGNKAFDCKSEDRRR
jgi:hypothetical protein